MMETNYFVCTLGEAANRSGGRPYTDVTHLIQTQAQQHPHNPAVGFYNVHSSKREVAFEPEIFSFREVQHGTIVTAGLLSTKLEGIQKGATVGLLAASSAEFMFVWLGCMWLGHPVLLIAPECSATGIAHLCQECAVSVIITDERNKQLAQRSADSKVDGVSSGFVCIDQPFIGQEVFETLRSMSLGVVEQPEPVDGTSIAYFHHTSGTSSGQPKPIPQTHRGTVGALPALDGAGSATFTTTPLYHGGPADTFRAWTSNAMVWLFPGKDIPITAGNIVRCLECASHAAERRLCTAVTYFGAVPYVLQMMSEEEAGTSWLERMELVSVGGAALPEELGNTLVDRGVRLVSRFGSAECGFLLSSRRDYEQDKDWQYLRVPDESGLLKFEEREDGLSELVVLRSWPHMAKTNREDRSFATSDLFQSHPKKKNAWKYHSRADAQLTLVTGLKFDPTSLEAAIAAATGLVSDVLVFGNGRPYPGALLFRSNQASGMTDEDLIQDLAAVVEECCSQRQSHAKVPRSMLIFMPLSEQPLDKSSKGTILRSKAEERYASYIDNAYSMEATMSDQEVSDDEVLDTVKDLVQRLLPARAQMDVDTDLFSAGIDSAASIQIRKSLQKLLPRDADLLPTSIVEDCGTVRDLAKHIVRARLGRTTFDIDQSGNEDEYMRSLVKAYGNFNRNMNGLANMFHESAKNGHIVVLTGATGMLGSQVLDILRSNKMVTKVYCLVRGADKLAAQERVNKALVNRGFSALGTLVSDAKVEVLQASLSEACLGLDDRTYKQLLGDTTVIMHLAWSVNFRWKLRSFARDLAGVQNLINLGLAANRPEAPRLMFCSSVASVIAYHGSSIPEALIDDPGASSDTGYSQSKWVAEQVFRRANEQERLHGRVSIFRVGQLSGDSRTGIWNTREAWPMMLSTIKLIGTLPDLGTEVLDWLPVDFAAAAMVQGALAAESSERTLRVFHVLNNQAGPTWTEMLGWLRKRIDLETVPPEQWLHKLELEAEQGSTHPALQLLDHWKKTLTTDDCTQSDGPKFDTTDTRRSISVLRDAPAVDEAYFAKLWSRIQEDM